MINFSTTWKKRVNLKEISYDDFVTQPISKAFFLEKVDGILGVLVYKENEYIFFQSTTAKEIIDLPVLEEYEKIFKKKGIYEAKIVGELVAKKGTNVLPFNTTQSVVKRFSEIANKKLIFHYPYDIISLNNSNPTFKEAIKTISTLFKRRKYITIPTFNYGGLEEFRSLYRHTKKRQGFDGVVVRELKGKNYKVKFTSTVDLVVIGIGEEGMRAWKKGQASNLLAAFIDKSGRFRISTKVGTGFTFKKRKEFFDYAKDNSLYKQNKIIFIKPKLIIEVKYLRARIVKMPIYNYVSDRYEKVGMDKSVTLAEPRFQRLRADKKPNKFDVRLEQIPEWRY
jgi:ATP-dependent DNA ligase